MRKSLLTIDDLVQFCLQNNITSFSEKEMGYSLRVQVPAIFEQEEDRGTMMFGKIKLMHTGRNRNGSFLTEDAAEKCMSSIKYKPLLANFCEYEDEDGNTVKDFTSHDMEINEDGTVTYIEKQIGCFTAEEPYMEQEDSKRKFIYAEVAIPRNYTDACEIIERKKGTKVSAELDILKMSYDAKEKVLMLEEVELLGATCLGVNPETHKPVEEGMAGARIDIEDFSSKNNAVVFDVNTEIVKTLQELNNTLKDFNKDNARKEDGILHEQFEDDTLKKIEGDPDVTPAEVTETPVEPTEGAEPAEPTEPENTETEAENEGETEPEGEADPAEPTEGEGADESAEASFELRSSINFGGTEKTFSLSLNEKLNAIYALVNETYGEIDDTFYDVEVYEDEKVVVMHSWWGGKHFKQSFKEKKGVFSLVGDRVEVFAQFLTEDEIKALENMKANYSHISEELQKYEDEPKKVEILNSAKYSYVADTEKFEELKKKENHFDLSVDEVEIQANNILLYYAAKGQLKTFEASANTVSKKTLPVSDMSDKKKSSRYGNLVKKN